MGEGEKVRASSCRCLFSGIIACDFDVVDFVQWRVQNGRNNQSNSYSVMARYVFVYSEHLDTQPLALEKVADSTGSMASLSGVPEYI